jgi:serine-type D-Ala-D-Ala endopeptidase (penicillin-binding protein 7)
MAVLNPKRALAPWLAMICLALGLAAWPAANLWAASPAASTKTHKASKSATSGKATKSAKPARKAVPAKSAALSKQRAVRVAKLVPATPSFGQLSGLRATEDDLSLKSSVALVMDQDTDEVLFSKNPQAVLPIASITKLMTALVVTEASLPLDEILVVSPDDVAATAGSRSRLQLGTHLTRGEMLHLSLMASENRAAHVLGRTYPGGMDRFVSAMNVKAHQLGMQDTRYVEPTGLSSSNQSSAVDLSRLVKAAFLHPIIRDLSTSLEAAMPVGRKSVQFRNTNGLVRNPEWDIGLQKTGYISAAGRCLVMQTQMAGRNLIMVLLDSTGKYTRIGDAERIRKWLATSTSLLTGQPVEPAAKSSPLVQPL